MPDYRRWRIPGGTYAFTVNLLNRRSTLLVDRIDRLRYAFRRVRAAHPFHIDAIVILPDHLHCIWTLPADDDDYSMRWRRIKTLFSLAIAPTESRSDTRRRRGERGIWQHRFWEHVIRDDDDYANHVAYIHYNPVRHGLTNRPVDWRYSSIHAYIRHGVINPDWGGDYSDPGLDLE
jgi:putative transposase